MLSRERERLTHKSQLNRLVHTAMKVTTLHSIKMFSDWEGKCLWTRLSCSIQNLNYSHLVNISALHGLYTHLFIWLRNCWILIRMHEYCQYFQLFVLLRSCTCMLKINFPIRRCKVSRNWSHLYIEDNTLNTVQNTLLIKIRYTQ